MTAHQIRRIVGAAGVLVDAYVHYYLYFWGGYRGISPERVLGLDISRSFATNAIVGLAIAELLILSLRWEKLALPAAMLGVLFAAGSLGAYLLTRTTGFLGFMDHQTSTEAIVAMAAEIVAVVALGSSFPASVRSRQLQSVGVS